MTKWQLQDAKARLSEVIKKAVKEGPQSITIHGQPTAVLLSNEEYERIKKPRVSFIKFMQRSPLYGLDLNVKREQTRTRDVDIA